MYSIKSKRWHVRGERQGKYVEAMGDPGMEAAES
jgi:hypothetical protein